MSKRCSSLLCLVTLKVLVSLFQPQNILLTNLSPLGDIKLVDFGLARRLGTAGELREILGTPEYVGKTCSFLWAKHHSKTLNFTLFLGVG